jgi:hypothetical protein
VLKSLAETTRLARMLLESQLEGSRRHRSYAQHRLRHRYQRCRGHDYLGTGDGNGKRYTYTKTPTLNHNFDLDLLTERFCGDLQ